ncbi:MAG: hypothetical protein WD627_03585 [Actinomycetota bacterium]
MTDESIEDAMSQIPGLRENVSAHKPEPTGVDYFAETPGDDPSVAKRKDVEDSDAVAAALDQIPGLRKKLGQ